MRFIFLTMEVTNNSAIREAVANLKQKHQLDIDLKLYNMALLRGETAWQKLAEDVGHADFIFGSMLFSEEIVRPLEKILDEATCPVCIITSNPALIQTTKLGKFVMKKPEEAEESSSPIKKLMGRLKPKHGHGESQRQLGIVRNLSKVLKLIPGKARDLYTFISAHQYWLNGSTENLERMLCNIIDQYVPGYKGKLPLKDPLFYPDVALYHPEAPEHFETIPAYKKWQKQRGLTPDKGRVALLTMRASTLGGNTAHIHALTQALEKRGIEVTIAYCGGLDFRPAIESFFRSSSSSFEKQSKDTLDIDLLINGTGFSLVGGPAESRPQDAQKILNTLDVAYLEMIPLAFQKVKEWKQDDMGLSPVQLALSVAIPELDGAAEPRVYGGPISGGDKIIPIDEEIELAAERISRRIKLRKESNADKKLAVVLFNFPPNLGNVGTAAYLDVFASLHRFMLELKEKGYQVEVPETPDALREAIVNGNHMTYGTTGNVEARFSVQDYKRLFKHYHEIEPFWGDAPGELLNDGENFLILGKQFGNVFIGQQPSFGYERDPMRLLMAKDAAPHHGFAAFYTWLDHIYQADAVLHFGTHGALEFMPGKQNGLSASCWPTRLLGNLTNFYYYCVNNPSEGTIAKRRSSATLVSYMAPPLEQAGLYKGLRQLKDQIDAYRKQPSAELFKDICTQAEKLEINVGSSPFQTSENQAEQNSAAKYDIQDEEAYIAALAHDLIRIEERMIPMGLHVLGKPATTDELTDILSLVASFNQPDEKLPPLPELLTQQKGWNYDALRKGVKTDKLSQQRWQDIERVSREAIRQFVTIGNEPHRTTSGKNISQAEFLRATFPMRRAAAEEFLEKESGLKPGTLEKLWQFLNELIINIIDEQELEGLLRALDGRYISPSPGNDVVRNPAVVPTGRNIHGLDPFRMPSAFAQTAGQKLVDDMLERAQKEQNALPETIAMVLWGTDNLKSDGEGVAQALALLGARAVQDELGNIASVELVPLEELGRPRIDVVITVSGIFRDLLTHQMKLLDKAARLAATANEPLEKNFVRKHAKEQAKAYNIPLDEAATRVYSNAPGSYGANVNYLVEGSSWEDDSQLGEAFTTRKCFTMNQKGEWREEKKLFESSLSTVDMAFQNVDSFEIGISDIDHYYEYLGGVTKTVEKLRSKRPSVVVADAIGTGSGERLSSLEEMVRLETRAKVLNPKWYESMLKHGYEGVHEIEAHVNNTYGWSATAAAVEGWVYKGVAETYLQDGEMRERLAKLNPHATAGIARRLLEANSRGFWEADEATLEELREIYHDLEDRLEKVSENA
ncbi:magnesium chelatase, H subunit [Chloroherpeton thalassium ATCC 35110]|uniref:magnesium chelatase n=1 Tax=Chloroherpeton thalassium (strain ATCC 35110 / GB-78) TaxID=517418 RepID=B3QZ55_CHLT3|nr:magnesium chelatase subunit H [Chloroherpeton thalassium]ACF13748.1 magnesium chelatase, H subunit [Chloroherpeton thalassium ATCC 35110]